MSYIGYTTYTKNRLDDLEQSVNSIEIPSFDTTAIDNSINDLQNQINSKADISYVDNAISNINVGSGSNPTVEIVLDTSNNLIQNGSFENFTGPVYEAGIQARFDTTDANGNYVINIQNWTYEPLPSDFDVNGKRGMIQFGDFPFSPPDGIDNYDPSMVIYLRSDQFTQNVSLSSETQYQLRFLHHAFNDDQRPTLRIYITHTDDTQTLLFEKLYTEYSSDPTYYADPFYLLEEEIDFTPTKDVKALVVQGLTDTGLADMLHSYMIFDYVRLYEYKEVTTIETQVNYDASINDLQNQINNKADISYVDNAISSISLPSYQSSSITYLDTNNNIVPNGTFSTSVDIYDSNVDVIQNVPSSWNYNAYYSPHPSIRVVGSGSVVNVLARNPENNVCWIRGGDLYFDTTLNISSQYKLMFNASNRPDETSAPTTLRVIIKDNNSSAEIEIFSKKFNYDEIVFNGSGKAICQYQLVDNIQVPFSNCRIMFMSRDNDGNLDEEGSITNNMIVIDDIRLYEYKNINVLVPN